MKKAGFSHWHSCRIVKIASGRLTCNLSVLFTSRKCSIHNRRFKFAITIFFVFEYFCQSNYHSVDWFEPIPWISIWPCPQPTSLTWQMSYFFGRPGTFCFLGTSTLSPIMVLKSSFWRRICPLRVFLVVYKAFIRMYFSTISTNFIFLCQPSKSVHSTIAKGGIPSTQCT